MTTDLKQYKIKQWNLVKQSCLDLFQLGEKIGSIQSTEDNVWKLTGKVNEVIEDMEDEKWGVYKNAVLQLLLPYASTVRDAVVSITEKYEQKINLPVDVSKIDKHEPLAQAGINESTIKKWEQLYAAGDEEEKKKLQEEMDTIVTNIEFLIAQFVIITTMRAPAMSIEAYDPPHVIDYLRGNKTDYNLPNIVRTILDAKNGEKEGRDIALASFDYFERFVQKSETEITWVDSFVLFIVLDFLYDRFPRLAPVQQTILLQFYFHKAIAFGLDVRGVLQAELKAAGSVVSYLNRSKNLFEMLDNNKEMVIVFDKNTNGEVRPFKDIVAFVESAMQKEGKTLEEAVATFYPESVPRREFYFGTLAEAVDISIRVGDASLIDWFTDHEVTKDEQYQYDILRLTYSFGYGGDFYHIREYFEKTDPLVPLEQFLHKLADVVDLSNEKFFDIALRFSQFLKEKQWLPEEVELVEFREQDGKFHWNNAELSLKTGNASS